jgi:hypothetical protein
MYNVNRNKYQENPKNSAIQTPEQLCQFLYDLIKIPLLRNVYPSGLYTDRDKQHINIFDPCCSTGNLLFPFWKCGFTCHGFDTDLSANIKDYGLSWKLKIINYLDIKNEKELREILQLPHYAVYEKLKEWINLVIINPPFNADPALRKYLKTKGQGKALLPELFLDQTWKLFGKDIPCVCFVPSGFRLNQRKKSKRWRKVRDDYPEIKSIISLPLDIFPGVLFHTEILIFNLDDLRPHYFLDYL